MTMDVDEYTDDVEEGLGALSDDCECECEGGDCGDDPCDCDDGCMWGYYEGTDECECEPY